ncbi:Mut7-C RNAse domain-containing protein [Chitinophagaceae bacterium LB-8]|uniref:Mut7-C RNAse domain-containing protein n=1 Tax=Paraflavisolibacter caeni TaxID=2982496 RepID=A0A9X2XSY5_9BACT|nr:heavy metal-binding domain-containing protein [Paraflavisolibacter caeni]MCU7548190.1 Mut7-C RNAse domain-containing protein [Paraflavisolibacter caeni]
MKKIIIMITILLSAQVMLAQAGNNVVKGKNVPAPTVQAKYTCPMHPEVVSNVTGRCPKCNAPLTQSKKEAMKMSEMKLYICPMHPDVKSDKPGTCPKCGMSLAKQKVDKKQKKAEAYVHPKK